MGNCQAIDAAALVIQHPNGKIERFYWQILASEVMRLNPGHYVSLIIPLPDSGEDNNNSSEPNKKTVQFTRVKLLRPTDTLNLGHAYRLVTTQEVMKVLRAKKYAKMKKQRDKSQNPASEKQSSDCETVNRLEIDEDNTEKDNQATRHERHRPRQPSSTLRSKSWRPKLQSISEFTS
ncbi:uncharacterized protein LOC126686463 [Mercurialis annua]|uniref:uncharacterized protein LOC126686463 n=1 Tax=Mercurialis annua TaxID=3986 RepID=UPI00215FF7D2|nr:uncharacterized protein LOC126686463 [Mercurialis annua]